MLFVAMLIVIYLLLKRPRTKPDGRTMLGVAVIFALAWGISDEITIFMNAIHFILYLEFWPNISSEWLMRSIGYALISALILTIWGVLEAVDKAPKLIRR